MNRRTLRRTIAIACFGWATSGAVAFAAPTAAEKETARGLVDEGDKRTEAGDLPGALKAYRAAHAIMNVPTTGIEVAKTLVKLGRLTEARDLALGLAAAKATPGEPAAFGEARAEADKLAEKLEPRIPSLVIEVKGAPDGADVVVKVDESKLPGEALGLPRRVDPGKHVVSADAPGRAPAHVEVTVAEGENKPVTLTLLVPTSNADERPSKIEHVATKVDGSLGTSPLVFGGFLGGGAAFLIGTFTGIGSLAKASTAKHGCMGNICPAGNQQYADASRGLAVASDIAFGLAAVGAGIGIYGLVTQKPETPAKASFTPYVTPLGAGAVVRF